MLLNKKKKPIDKSAHLFRMVSFFKQFFIFILFQWHFCLLLAFLPTAGGLPVNKSQALVDYINSQNKWVARQNPQFEDLSKLKQLMGTTLGFKSKNIVNVTDSGEVTDALPKEFDARTNWPICKNIIGRIVDQSECGRLFQKNFKLAF